MQCKSYLTNLNRPLSHCQLRVVPFSSAFTLFISLYGGIFSYIGIHMFPKQAYYFLNGNIMVDRIMETLCKESFASHSAAMQQNPQRRNTRKPGVPQHAPGFLLGFSAILHLIHKLDYFTMILIFFQTPLLATTYMLHLPGLTPRILPLLLTEATSLLLLK